MLFDLDYWTEALTTVRQHKLRSVLTAFGVFWGMFLLVVLLAIIDGYQEKNLKGFTGMENTVFIWSAAPTRLAFDGFSKGRKIELSFADLHALRENIEALDTIAYENWVGNHQVTYDNNGDIFFIMGSSPPIQSLRSIGLSSGRYFNPNDLIEKRKVAVLGSRVAGMFFGSPDKAIGKEIAVNLMNFTVIGVIGPSPTGADQRWMEGNVFIPTTTLASSFDSTVDIRRFLLTPKNGVEAAYIEQQVRLLLQKRHHIHPQDLATFGSYNVEANYLQQKRLFDAINQFGWLVAIGTLLTGVLGVSNILLVTVKERSREIGIRKAIGSPNRSIIVMVLLETLLIVLFSGFIGLIVGVAAIDHLGSVFDALGAKERFFDEPQPNFAVALVGLLALLVSALIAGLIPAIKAAMIEPARVITDE